MRSFLALALVVAFGLPMPAFAQRILDPPHAGIVVDPALGDSPCAACHGPQVAGLPRNEVCAQCHGDLPTLETATFALTHGSAVTGTSRFQYELECVACHNPHDQEQDFRWGTTYGKYVMTEISESIWVVDQTVSPPVGANKGVWFFPRFTNEFQLATGSDPAVDPINNWVKDVCSGCHTLTNHHQNDGTAPGGQDHNNGSDCTVCHNHENGFGIGFAGGDHPQATETDCGLCHGDLVTGETDLVPIHLDNCSTCHPSDFSETILGPIGTWGGSCSECHDVEVEHFPVTGEHPQAITDCSPCHDDPASGVTELLPTHLDACASCHVPGGDTILGPIGTWQNECTECHVVEQEHFPVTGEHGQAVTDCSPCHDDPASGLTELVSTHNDSCTYCHLSGTDTVLGPVGSWQNECTECHVTQEEHFPVTGEHPQALTDCSPCHDDPATGLTEIVATHNDTCESCHLSGNETVLGPIGTWQNQCTECHNPDVEHFPGGAHRQAVTDCSPCHDNPQTGQPDLLTTHNQSCTTCHLSGTQTVLGPIGTWGGECTECHVDPDAEHFPVTGLHPQATPECSLCHSDPATGESEIVQIHMDDCARCHLSGAETILGPIGTWNNDCTACHEPDQAHFGGNEHPQALTDCSPCHDDPVTGDTELLPLHTENCAYCHVAGGDTILGAIGSWDQECTACHDPDQEHFPDGMHPQALTDCSNCHEDPETGQPDLLLVHGDDCESCHVSSASTLAGALGTWDYECSSCHNSGVPETGGVPTPELGHRCVVCHGDQRSTSSFESFHKRHADEANCVVCHGFIPDVGTEIGSGNRQICAVCHSGGRNGSIEDIHEKHTKKGVSCLECHGGVRPPVDVFFGPPVGNTRVVCEICHDYEDDSPRKIHEEHVDMSMDCGSCHMDAILQDDRVPMPAFDDSRRALVDRRGYNECNFCHGSEGGGIRTAHRKHVSYQWQWCYNCHEGGDDRPMGLSGPVREPAQACRLCHDDESYRDSTPFDIHEEHAGKNKCYACHQTVPQIFDWPREWLETGSGGGWGGWSWRR